MRSLALDDGGGIAHEDFRGRLVHRIERGVVLQAAVGNQRERLHEAIGAAAVNACDHPEIRLRIQPPESARGRRHLGGGLAEEKVMRQKVALVRQLVSGELLRVLRLRQRMCQHGDDAVGGRRVGLLLLFRRHHAIANLVAHERPQFAFLRKVAGERVEPHIALLLFRAVALDAMRGEEGTKRGGEARLRPGCGRGGCGGSAEEDAVPDEEGSAHECVHGCCSVCR